MNSRLFVNNSDSEDDDGIDGHEMFIGYGVDVGVGVRVGVPEREGPPPGSTSGSTGPPCATLIPNPSATNWPGEIPGCFSQMGATEVMSNSSSIPQGIPSHVQRAEDISPYKTSSGMHCLPVIRSC